MFDFTESKLIKEKIIKIAEDDGLPPLRVAINANGYRQSNDFWGQPDASEVYRDESLGILIRLISIMAVNGKVVVGIRSLYETARKVEPFIGLTGVMNHLKDELAHIDKMNITCLIGDKIYAHPAILDECWQPNFKVYEGEHPSRLPYHLRYSEEEVEVAMEFYRKAKLLLSGK